METSIVCCKSISKLLTWGCFRSDSQRWLFYTTLPLFMCICLCRSNDAVKEIVEGKSVERWDGWKF